MDISVVICTYNRAESLRTTLRSLEAMIIPPALSWELIVIDNNSTDATKSVVDEFRRNSNLPVRYHFEPEQGLSHARNAGVRAAHGEIIAFTDDDCLVDKEWLQAIYSTFALYNCAAVGGRIRPLWSVERPGWLAESGPLRLSGPTVSFDHGDETRLITTSPFGANMSFRKTVFGRYGWFDGRLGPAGPGQVRIGGGRDDTEFCRRLLRAGERIAYSAEAVVFHPVEPERAHKTYFQSWYFNYGKSLVMTSGIPKNAICYLGVPRFLFKMLLIKVWKWLIAFDPVKRFYCKVEAYEILGQISESRRYRRSSRKASSKPIAS
jgi:glucosyl-dolichyl phosphate glucuronosyltransferase